MDFATAIGLTGKYVEIKYWGSTYDPMRPNIELSTKGLVEEIAVKQYGEFLRFKNNWNANEIPIRAIFQYRTFETPSEWIDSKNGET